MSHQKFYSMLSDDLLGKQSKNPVYVSLIHFAVYLKLSQHSKQINYTANTKFLKKILKQEMSLTG